MGNNWILIVREKYGKTLTFQSYGFLTYFMCGINTHDSQNMRKVNSHSKEKWENMNISKLRVSGIFCWKQKSMRFPTHGKSGFPWYGKSMGKHKHFKFMGFLKILDETEIHTIHKTWEKWILIIREKYGKKKNIPKFCKYFGWSRNPYSSQNMGKVNSHSKGKIWENTNISKLSVSEIFRLMQKSM